MKDKLVSDMVERCEAEKNESDHGLKQMKVKMIGMQKELDDQKADNEAAKQWDFGVNKVKNKFENIYFVDLGNIQHTFLNLLLD